jgi:hypothetical protein
MQVEGARALRGLAEEVEVRRVGVGREEVAEALQWPCVAAGPGTAVEPTWSTRTATPPSESSTRAISAAAVSAQAGSWSTIRTAGSKCSSRLR